MSAIDDIYRRMQDPAESKSMTTTSELGESELAKFYSGLDVFVTGATDIIGKCLIDKLLRDCEEIGRIYILLRTRKNQDFNVECEKFFRNDVFSTLRKINPDFEDKITPLRGDLTLEKLGLTDKEYEELTKNVGVIVHNGSTKKLDERINVTLRTNVHGTKRILELARQCKKLKILTYVSTAYSHSPKRRVIEEKFYPYTLGAAADTKAVDDMIAADTETIGLSKDALKMLLGDWTDVYTFSKATAEELIQQYAVRSPHACCVFRPSVVISAYKEPKPGWCDASNGPASFFAKIAKGAIHVVYKSENLYPCDLVPVDLCVNGLLVCTWDSFDRWQIEPGAFVYNYGSSAENPLNVIQIKEKIMAVPDALATTNGRRVPYVMLASNMLTYLTLRVIFDYVPAIVLDFLSCLHGGQCQSWKLVRESMSDLCRLQRLLSRNHRIRMPETLKACERLNERDRELFFSDVRRLDWGDYFMTYWRGIRLYHLKESPNENTGRKKCPFFDDSFSSAKKSRSSSDECQACKCPCACPCVCLLSMMSIAFLAFYLINRIFF